MIPIGLSMRHTFADLGLADCVRQLADRQPGRGDRDACDAASTAFTNQYGSLNLVAVLLIILPVLVGLFWGAPLVAREVEHGTHRFVWTQGVGRTPLGAGEVRAGRRGHAARWRSATGWAWPGGSTR